MLCSVEKESWNEYDRKKCLINPEDIKIHTYYISQEHGAGYCISIEKKGFPCEREPLLRDYGFNNITNANMHAERKLKEILKNPEQYGEVI